MAQRRKEPCSRIGEGAGSRGCCCGACLVGQLGRLGAASVWTAVLIVVVGAPTGWLYWLNMRRAMRLPDSDIYTAISESENQRPAFQLIFRRSSRLMGLVTLRTG